MEGRPLTHYEAMRFALRFRGILRLDALQTLVILVWNGERPQPNRKSRRSFASNHFRKTFWYNLNSCIRWHARKSEEEL